MLPQSSRCQLISLMLMHGRLRSRVTVRRNKVGSEEEWKAEAGAMKGQGVEGRTKRTKTRCLVATAMNINTQS